MKRLFCVFACLLVLFAGTSANAKERFVLCISTPTADHGWTGGIVWWAGQAIAELANQYPNIEFIYRSSACEQRQVADIEFFLENGMDALVILPHRPAPLTTVLNRVHQSGAYIVTVDRSIPKVPKNVYLAGDNYGFGYECGRYMAQALGGTGRIVVMEGIPCEGNSLRVDGFKAGLGDAQIEILDSQPAYWDPAKGYELMESYLNQFSQIDAVWCGDDDVLEEALAAYEESGRSDVRFLLGGGGSKSIIANIIGEHPLVRATVTYPPSMIYTAIRMTAEHLVDGKEFDKEIVIPSQLVTRENAAANYFQESIY